MVRAEIAGRAIAVRWSGPRRRRWAHTALWRLAPWAPRCTAAKCRRNARRAVGAEIAGVDAVRLWLLCWIPECGPWSHGHLNWATTCCRGIYRLCAVPTPLNVSENTQRKVTASTHRMSRNLYSYCTEQVLLDSPRQLCDSCGHICSQIVVLADVSGDVVQRLSPSECLRLVIVALRQ